MNKQLLFILAVTQMAPTITGNTCPKPSKRLEAQLMAHQFSDATETQQPKELIAAADGKKLQNTTEYRPPEAAKQKHTPPKQPQPAAIAVVQQTLVAGSAQPPVSLEQAGRKMSAEALGASLIKAYGSANSSRDSQ